MKRIVIVLLLALGIAGACAAEGLVLHHQGEQLTELVQQAAESCRAGEWAQATQAAARLGEVWDTAERQLSFFVGHDDIRELELSITRLEPLSQAEDPGPFLTECALTEMLIHHIRENQKFRITNIL